MSWLYGIFLFLSLHKSLPSVVLCREKKITKIRIYNEALAAQRCPPSLGQPVLRIEQCDSRIFVLARDQYVTKFVQYLEQL